jgi:hypothetical protein
MAQVVPLKWYGSFANWGGPLASGESDHWWAAGGDWGRENRFYLFSAFGDGTVPAEIEVLHVSHYSSGGLEGNIVEETHFEIRNNGSAGPVFYYFYMAWSDPITV